MRLVDGLMNGPWIRYANLRYALEEDPPRPERLAVAQALTEHHQGKVRSFNRAHEALGAGPEWATPTPDLLRFVAHMYRVPAGYLTGEDDNQIRDKALDRACGKKVIEGTPIPDSFFVDTVCQPMLETPGDEQRLAVVGRMRKLFRRSVWAYLARPVMGLMMTAGWIAITLPTPEDWFRWFCVAMFATMTLVFFRVDLRRVRRALELLRLPQGRFQSVVEGRLREEVGANLQDLMTRTTFPAAWFHDTLCHQRPLSATDLVQIGAPELGEARIAWAAVDRQLRQPRD
ncbi:hypothetical protein ABH924_003271 [Arthrobacter sp. GAS37]|uniref:hypothetical protein n=1 Tax=Arthrobacter sp. GAS37 TaxID=3156261 RepID=UPI003838ECCE